MRPNLPSAVVCLIVILALLVIPGCETAKQDPVVNPDGTTTPVVKKVPAYIRISAATAGTATILAVTHDPVKRARYADYLYSSAVGVRTLIGSKPVSIAEFEASLKTFMPKSGEIQEWSELATSIAALYSSIKPSLNVGDKDYFLALEEIASGLEDAAAPWTSIK